MHLWKPELQEIYKVVKTPLESAEKVFATVTSSE